jgi:hypothetical protein
MAMPTSNEYWKRPEVHHDSTPKLKTTLVQNNQLSWHRKDEGKQTNASSPHLDMLRRDLEARQVLSNKSGEWSTVGRLILGTISPRP